MCGDHCFFSEVQKSTHLPYQRTVIINYFKWLSQCLYLNTPTPTVIFILQIYFTLITFAVFVIPAIIIAFCYGILVYIIVSKNSALKATIKRKQDRKPLYYNNGR